MADPLPEPARCLACGDELPPTYPNRVCPDCLHHMGLSLLQAQQAVIEPTVDGEASHGE